MITRHIHIDFFYFLTFFSMEIMNLAILRHLVTPHMRPLAPPPPMSAWQALPVIFERESMAKSKTISFFSHFFPTIFTHFHSVGHVAPFCLILPPPMNDPSTPHHQFWHGWSLQTFWEENLCLNSKPFIFSITKTLILRQSASFVILVHLVTLYGQPLNPFCWQIVKCVKLNIYAWSYITFVIMKHIHIDVFYFLIFFTI